MRKFYSLIAALILALLCLQTNAKTTEDSCRADFERVSSATINLLTTGFRALPWINSDKRPEQICWNFGDNHDTCINYDPALSNNYFVGHTYANAGTYNVCVKILYQGGCLAYHCKSVQVGEPDSCKVSFETVSATATTLGKYFVAQPWHNQNKKPVQVCWNFGDNHDTCIQYSTAYTGPYAVFHLYPHTDNYNVCVKILYDGGCESHYCKLVQVGGTDSCHADFERVSSNTDNLLTAGFLALPWNSSDKKPEQICWNFGDNHDTCINYDPALSNNYFVAHTYEHTGIYNVCVKIIYQGGCQAYNCKFIQIGEPDDCRANFEIVDSTVNSLDRRFIAQPWHNHNKKPVLVCWNFGDNHDTCIQYSTTYAGSYAVSHLYSHSDNYNVCVKILYDGGCESHYCRIVQAGEPRDSCLAGFETGPISSTPLGRHFVALPWHNHNKKPVYICWNFGDHHDTCIQYSNTNPDSYSVNHIYTERGQYEVCVRIVYDGGCEAKKCKIIQVGEPDSCRADFERIPVSTANNAFRVYYRALPWNNREKKPARICWSFGDGRDTCISYPENYTGAYTVGHNYERSGMYEVCVRITYFGGCEAKKCRIVNVFLYNADTCRVHLFEITPSVTSLTRGFYFTSLNDIRPARICWNFGDGTDTCINVEPNTTEVPHGIRHTYPAPGVYRACVRVLFVNGCSAGDCHEVAIRVFTDLCGGYFTDSLVNSHTYSFKGFSIHKPGDAVLSYRWTFGDGSSGNGQQVNHTYNVPGVYRVCLLINTEKGCETRICNDVRIAGTTQSTLQLSPNPVVNVLHALFYSTHNETVTIKIINSNGAVIRSFTRTAVAGSNAWDFDTGGLLPGVYSFVVQSPNQFASAIFFKL